MKPEHDSIRLSEAIIAISLLSVLTYGYFWYLIIENKYAFSKGALSIKYLPMRILINLGFEQDNIGITNIKYLFEGSNYPLNILLGYMANGNNTDIVFRLMGFSVILHLFIAAISMYFLARVGFRINRYGALLSSIVFTYSGMKIGHIADMKAIYSATWIPLYYLSLKEWVTHNDTKHLVLATIFSLLILLGGDRFVSTSAIVFIISVSFLSYTLLKKTSLSYLYIIILGVLLFVNNYFSVSENVLFGSSFWSFLRLFLYSIFPQCTSPDWWHYTIYIGIIPSVFVPIGICRAKYHSILNFKTIVISSSLTIFVLLLISYLRQEAYGSYFYLAKSRFIISMFLAILAGLGCSSFTEAMQRNEKSFFYKYCIFLRKLSLLAVLIASLIYGILVFSIKRSWHMGMIVSATNSIVWALIFLIAITIIFNLRLINDGKKYSFIILFLTVIDIFTFLSFRPS